MASRPSLQSSSVVLLLVSVVLAACGGGEGAASDSATPNAASAAASGAQPSAAERIYQQRCITCHQANGEGLTGVYPPLAGSEYATAANVAVPIRVVLHGLQGPITVKGAEYSSLMPAYGVGIVMSDEEVATILTYVRSTWGNKASAVTAADVARERAATADHTGAMTAELLKPLLDK